MVYIAKYIANYPRIKAGEVEYLQSFFREFDAGNDRMALEIAGEEITSVYDEVCARNPSFIRCLLSVSLRTVFSAEEIK